MGQVSGREMDACLRTSAGWSAHRAGPHMASSEGLWQLPHPSHQEMPTSSAHNMLLKGIKSSCYNATVPPGRWYPQNLLSVSQLKLRFYWLLLKAVRKGLKFATVEGCVHPGEAGGEGGVMRGVKDTSKGNDKNLVRGRHSPQGTLSDQSGV